MAALEAELAGISINPIECKKIKKARRVEPSPFLASGTPGKLGTPTTLITNYFPLDLPDNAKIFQWDVKFIPEVESAGLARFLLRSQEQELTKGGNDWIFDGRAILYTLEPLGGKQVEFISTSRNTQFKIVITATATISTSTIGPQMIQVFNLVRRRSLRFLKLQQIGRNHFDLNRAIPVRGFNLKVVPGILSTIYPSANGLLYNTDIIFRTLHTDTVLDYIYRKQRESPSDYRSIIENELFGRIVMTNYSNKTFMVTSINWAMNPNDGFDRTSATGKAKRITFAKYFKEQYDVTVTDMKQPLLCCHRRRQNKDEYYLPELCCMTGLTEDMRKDFRLMRELKQLSILDPEPRLKRIQQSVKEASDNKEFQASLAQWRFNMNPNPLQIPCRVLPAPSIIFGNKKIDFADPSNAGEWAIRSDPLMRVPKLGKWVVISPPNSDREVTRFLDILLQVARPLGLNIDRPVVEVATADSEKAYIESLRKVVKPGQTQLVIVILETGSKNIYDRVKQFLCLETPILSQCVQFKTIRDEKGLHSKATKLVVQAATKIGAAPWTLDYKFPGPTMVIGMDVYHSGEIGPSRQKASIVGFTASMDAKITTYYSRVVKNPPGQELIKTLRPCVLAALRKFKEINAVFPSHIIVYRDGVGEGQVQEVLDNELRGFQAALNELNLKSQICWVVVLKRISTRLFPRSGNGIQNPVPGTIVDTDITHPDALEFFLVSQKVTQGTVNPTKYQVIFNEPKFSADYIQLLTHQLCHSYFNWFGTIRVPAPCQYAHKLAFLTGQSLGREDSNLRLATNLFFL